MLVTAAPTASASAGTFFQDVAEAESDTTTYDVPGGSLLPASSRSQRTWSIQLAIACAAVMTVPGAGLFGFDHGIYGTPAHASTRLLTVKRMSLSVAVAPVMPGCAATPKAIAADSNDGLSSTLLAQAVR